MRSITCLVGASLALSFVASTAAAQDWRVHAARVAPTARVLFVGTRPEDEDNALIAWLSLGRNVETAFLSLTRGEAGANAIGGERQSQLAVVRTAELLAERQRDGAHQYFTRAYDFGPTWSDSIVESAWPRDSLLHDVASVIRAFRPQVVIALSDSTDADATRRFTARLTREAFAVAADTIRLPASAASQLPGWRASRLLTEVDSAATPSVIVIDVGEFDRSSGRSFAELGEEIRHLQRTQPQPPPPGLGAARRLLRIDIAQSERGPLDLFANVDTTWNRFHGAIPADADAALDSLRTDLGEIRRLADGGMPDALASVLARTAKRANDVRLTFQCSDVAGVPACGGALGDLAASLNTVRERTTAAMLDAAGLVVDGTVARELVAAHDSVPVAVTVFNGGSLPVTIHRLAASSGNVWTPLVRDTAIVIRAHSMARWSANVRVLAVDYHWWQVHGLLAGTWLHDFETSALRPVVPQLISGEDRILASHVEATVGVGGTQVPIIVQPLVYRGPGTLRGDNRFPLVGVPPLSILLERAAEYERANLPIDRLFRVFVSSARSTPETVSVSLALPRGLKADSLTRTVALPAFGARNMFFRLHGIETPGSDTIRAAARVAASNAANNVSYNLGVITHEYPHIPSQQLLRQAGDRIAVVDLHVPTQLHLAYVKGTDDMPTPLGQLQIKVQTFEPALLPAVDLSGFSTILIGANAFANEALVAVVPTLLDFARKGGTVVVLPGGTDVARSGVLPFPIAFDNAPHDVVDPAAEVRTVDAKSKLLHWPNVITGRDFDGWVGERARNVPAGFDARYRTVLSTGDAGRAPTAGTLLVAPFGRGTIVYTTLSFDVQLSAANAGAARLFVNLLAAGLPSGGR